MPRLQPSPSPPPIAARLSSQARSLRVLASEPTTYDECQAYGYDWCAIPTASAVQFTAPGNVPGYMLKVKIDKVPPGWSITLATPTVNCTSDSCSIVFDATALSSATIGLSNLVWEDCVVQTDGSCKPVFTGPFTDPLQVSCNVAQTLPQPCPLGEMFDDFSQRVVAATGQTIATTGTTVGLAQKFSFQRDPASGVAGATYAADASGGAWTTDGYLVSSYDLNTGIAPTIVGSQTQPQVATTAPFHWWQESAGPLAKNVVFSGGRLTRTLANYTELSDIPTLQAQFNVATTLAAGMTATLTPLTLTSNVAPELGQTFAFGSVAYSGSGPSDFTVLTKGITFDYSLTAPQAGSIGVVQLLNEYCETIQSATGTLYYDAGTYPILDVTGDQTSTPFYRDVTKVSTAADTAFDSPNSNLAAFYNDGVTTSFTRGDQYNDVLMYRPKDTRTKTGTSIWVPAASRTWFFNGNALRQTPSGAFSLYNDVDYGQAASQTDYPSAPTWVSRVPKSKKDSFCVPAGKA